jgi:hypothetical protein
VSLAACAPGEAAGCCAACWAEGCQSFAVQARELADAQDQQPSSLAGACLWLPLLHMSNQLCGYLQCLASKLHASIACTLQLLQ